MANYADSTRTPRTLTAREQRLLLKVTGEHRAGYRDHWLYAMALGTGLREHELIALSVGDVFRDGRPRRRLQLSVFRGAGKAGGTQEVLLSESLRGKLRKQPVPGWPMETPN
jgi:integrase/recombinase XerC